MRDVTVLVSAISIGCAIAGLRTVRLHAGLVCLFARSDGEYGNDDSNAGQHGERASQEAAAAAAALPGMHCPAISDEIDDLGALS